MYIIFYILTNKSEFEFDEWSRANVPVFWLLACYWPVINCLQSCVLIGWNNPSILPFQSCNEVFFKLWVHLVSVWLKVKKWTLDWHLSTHHETFWCHMKSMAKIRYFYSSAMELPSVISLNFRFLCLFLFLSVLLSVCLSFCQSFLLSVCLSNSYNKLSH